MNNQFVKTGQLFNTKFKYNKNKNTNIVQS